MNVSEMDTRAPMRGMCLKTHAHLFATHHASSVLHNLSLQPDAQCFATHHASSVLHNLTLQPDAQSFATQHAPSLLRNLILHNDPAEPEAASACTCRGRSVDLTP